VDRTNHRRNVLDQEPSILSSTDNSRVGIKLKEVDVVFIAATERAANDLCLRKNSNV
jgi:hypothetical protein